MLAHGGVDTLDPERAELALFDPAVTVSIAQSLFEALQRDAVVGGRAADKAFRLLENLFVTGVGGNAPFYTCYLSAPLTRCRTAPIA